MSNETYIALTDLYESMSEYMDRLLRIRDSYSSNGDRRSAAQIESKADGCREAMQMVLRARHKAVDAVAKGKEG